MSLSNWLKAGVRLVILKSIEQINVQSEFFSDWLVFFVDGGQTKESLQSQSNENQSGWLLPVVSRAVKTTYHTFTTQEEPKWRHWAKHELKQNKESAEGVVKSVLIKQ